MDNPIEGTCGKLRHGFVSVGGLREINIGHKDKPRPMCVSVKSDPKYQPKLINLLEVVLLDEMVGLDRSTA